ncbi:hypothetical protein C8R43DRAFT_1181201 [Mycena crocata]|nr:hypothetical protein C8R43DRAFT_1181201 [Mycena crocata]
MVFPVLVMMDTDGAEVLQTLMGQSPTLVLSDGELQTATQASAELDFMEIDAADDSDVSMVSADPVDLFAPPSSSSLEVFPVEELLMHADEDVTEIVNDGQPSAEALEKKGIPLEASSEAVGSNVHVPQQPNFCDCSIYLLHLAQTFISDPSRFYNLITAVSKKGSNTHSLECQRNWNDEGIKTFRETLKRCIAKLSIEWKKARAAKEELKKGQENTAPGSSDDEVNIVDTTPAPQPKVKTPKTGKDMRMGK